MMTNETIRTEDYLKEMLIVLRETFEGSPPGTSSTFLDQEIGFFSTIEQLDYKSVSETVAGTTIVAHTEHAKFYIDRFREFMTGKDDKINWEQSWLIETVNEEEWDILRKGVRKSYDQLLQAIAGIETWNHQNIGESIAVIAHTAYHLGSIRLAMKALNSGAVETSA